MQGIVLASEVCLALANGLNVIRVMVFFLCVTVLINYLLLIICFAT